MASWATVDRWLGGRLVTDFEFWQQNECAILNLTKEEHDEIVARCYRVSAGIGAYAGELYDFITNLIYQEQWKQLFEQLQKISDGLDIRQQSTPIDKLQCNCGKAKHPGRHHRRGCRLRR